MASVADLAEGEAPALGRNRSHSSAVHDHNLPPPREKVKKPRPDRSQVPHVHAVKPLGAQFGDPAAHAFVPHQWVAEPYDEKGRDIYQVSMGVMNLEFKRKTNVAAPSGPPGNEGRKPQTNSTSR
jgi:hypothetical protein